MVYRKRPKGLPPGKASPGFKKIKKKPSPEVVRKTKKSRREDVLYEAEWQHGASNIPRDVARLAKPPGKRISRSGKVYYEYRRNRSDRRNRI